DFLAGLAALDLGPQVLKAGDRLAVQGNDNVVHSHARLARGRFGINLGDLALLGVGVGLNAQARRRQAGEGVAFGQALPGFAVGVHRHVDVGADAPLDLTVDANDAALHVEERAAGVAADQHAVGANHHRAAVEHAAQPNWRGAPLLVAAGVAEAQA